MKKQKIKTPIIALSNSFINEDGQLISVNKKNWNKTKKLWKKEIDKTLKKK